jgi:THO complex subunit 4
MNRQHQHAAGRFNNFHGPKRQLVGNHTQVQPAWKPNAAGRQAQQQVELASGSKILLSRLPTDVGEKEVEVCGVWVCSEVSID